MAKPNRPAKETGMPVIISLVFFVVLTIGLGVFVYVLYSDQEAKDKAVADSKKEVTDMRAAVKDAENTVRVMRIFTGLDEGTGNEADLIVVQNDVKEGSKPFQELQKLNAEARKRGPAAATAIAAKVDPKLDTTALVTANDFDIWPTDLDDKKQLKAPKTNLLDVAVRARLFRDLALKATSDDRTSYDASRSEFNASSKALKTRMDEFQKAATQLPKDFEQFKIDTNKTIDGLRDGYRKNEATTRAEVDKKNNEIDALKLDIRKRDEELVRLREVIYVLNAKKPKDDPFAYDAPQGKITTRLADNIVEINLGSNAHVQAGLTFTVLPIDFPQKGRVSRMMNIRVPDDRGNYKDIEMFTPKAMIEVIEVLGPDVSRARITYEYNDVRDRVLPGDLLYNSVWRKGQADHIALIGIFDLNGDGTDDIENLVRDLNKMGIPVDAYFDLKTKKWIGKLNERTRYLVEGFTPVTSGTDPNLPAKTAMLTAMKTAREEAATKQVQPVPARDFFGRIGYKAKIDVSEDRINQAASKYLGGVAETPPPNQ